MRIYLAARFGRRIELCGYAAELERVGITVTSRWIRGNHEAEGDDLRDRRALARRYATEDLADIDAADAVISFTEEPDVEGRARGGRHVEFGYAYARGKRLATVGPVENVFHALLGVMRFPNWETCRDALIGAANLQDTVRLASASLTVHEEEAPF